MSKVLLNHYFPVRQVENVESDVSELSIQIPVEKLFMQLADYPAPHLQDLSQRAERLQVLESRLQDAKTHQNRDRLIACVAGAAMVGLVAAIVLGAYYCTSIAISAAILLFIISFISSVIVGHAADKDGRKGYEMIKYADLFCVGIPRLMSHFLTRKRALQDKVNPLRTSVRDDLLVAGLYLQQHIPAIREKLNYDIAAFQAALAQASQWQLPIRLNLADLHKALNDSQTYLAELNEKAQPMVNCMIQAGIIPSA